MDKIYITARFLTQPITGVQRYGIELSLAIKKLSKDYGYDVKFLSPSNIIHNEVAQALEVIKIGTLKGQLWDQISLLNFLKKEQNPMVVNFSNTLPVFYKNKIVTIHDIIHLKYPVSYSYRKYYEIVFPLMVKYSKHIITVSEFSKKEIASYFGISEDKISVVYNGVSRNFRPMPTKTTEDYILGVSSIAYHKNFLGLLEAFTKLKTRNLKLYIAGGINYKVFGKKSRKIIERALSNENIVFLGRVSDEELIKLYSNAKCFVYPSLCEGFGIPPLEAQACGCPIAISDIPVFREIYGDSAIYFDPYNPDDIANKIEELVNDENKRTLLIEKGLSNAKKYSWEESAKKFFNILDKTVIKEM